MMNDQAQIERFERERQERIEASLRRFEMSLHKPPRRKKWAKWQKDSGQTGGANHVENQEVFSTG